MVREKLNTVSISALSQKCNVTPENTRVPIPGLFVCYGDLSQLKII